MRIARPERLTETGAGRPDPTAHDFIELLFFAYRDFVGDADRVLAHYGFGRAHHRVLHFVARRPGLTVADLLEVLRITKQSLNRVLKELVATGFVEQRAGTADRRQRLLYATSSGADLAKRLSQLQERRIGRALDGVDVRAARDFLRAMIGPETPPAQARGEEIRRDGAPGAQDR